jgi:Flp pilus assembly protein TadG
LKLRSKPTVGQTLVEFALVIPSLLLIIFGMFEFGRMLQVWITVQNSAQAAARYATTGQQSVDPAIDKWDSIRLAAIKDVARSKAVSLSIDNSAGPSSPGYFHVYVYASDPPIKGIEYPGGPNARVAVDVVFNHPLVTPLINMIAPYITLKAHAEMINERFRHPGYGIPVGILPPTIFPTPVPTNTPINTAIPTLQPTSTSTSTAQATSTTTPTQITTTIPTATPTPTAVVTATRTRIPTRTPRP